MPKPCVAEALLSLFAARDRAAAIVGDLTEESRARGNVWFYLHPFGTALATGFLTGMALERWKSASGASALAPLVVFCLTSWLVWPLLAEYAYSLSWHFSAAIAAAIPLLYLAPLLAGGILVARLAPRR